ncbi:MAG: hypothetical protein GX974_06410, partial [Clostridiales bacterium]|nr:hypothetical protein [Clostridiales bacterium]
DCYYPEKSSEGYYESHEAICVLNTGERDANLNITLYFEDREPSSGFKAICPSKRTNHVRLDEITDDAGRKIPRGVPYAIVLESDEPIVAQYSRLDTTQAELGLMTTMAYPL